jgi:hypothetical protein
MQISPCNRLTVAGLIEQKFKRLGYPAVGTSNDSDACKKPFTNPTVSSYVDSLYLLVHEGRHNQPGDQGHIVVNGSQLDPCLENGSGHAWAAMYSMWGI